MRLNKTRNLPASDKRSKIIFIFMQLNKGKTTMRIHLDCWKDCKKCNVRKKKKQRETKSWARVQSPKLQNYNPNSVRGAFHIKFLHRRHSGANIGVLSLLHSDEEENLVVWCLALVTNTFLGVFTWPRGFLLPTNTPRSSEPAPLGLRVNRGKLYANVTFRWVAELSAI